MGQFLAAGILLAGVVGCRSERTTDFEPVGGSEVALLLPQLEARVGELSRMELRSQSGVITLEKSDGQWSLGAPFGVPVYGPYLNQALTALIQATAGQRLVLTEEERRQVGLPTAEVALPTSDTVQVALFFGKSAAPVELALGAFDNRTHAEETVAYGEAATARRFVALPGGAVVLTPTNLTALTPAAENWEGRGFPPLRRLAWLEVTARDGRRWQAKKTSSFSPILVDGEKPPREIAPDLIRIFDTFLGKGFHHGVVVEPGPLEGAALTIVGEDRFGGRYRVEVFGPHTEGKAVAAPGENLRKGFLGLSGGVEGGAQKWICRLTVALESEDPAVRRQLETLRRHPVLLGADDLYDVIAITERRQN